MSLVKVLPRFRQAYRELGRLEEREKWSRAEIEAFQLERLNSLWGNACLNTRHYRELCKQRSLPASFRSLDEFYTAVPIVSKDDMRRDPDAYLSELRPRGEWISTGGSTGQPFKVYWTREGSIEALRSRYRYYAMWGVDIFDRIAFLWGHSNSFAPGLAGRLAKLKQPILDRLRNRLRLSIYNLSHAQVLKYLEQISAFEPLAIYSYPSALDVIASAAEEAGIEFPTLKLATVTGEVVQPRAVEHISRVFGAPTTVEYGTAECGPLAHEWPDRKLHVREDQILLETLPSRDGRFEIIVTVLANSAYPLIRYRLADMTDAPLDNPERGFRSLQRIIGRENDFIITREGERLHSARFDAFFKHECKDVRRFRLRQHRDGSVAVILELNGKTRQNLQDIRGRISDITGGHHVDVEIVEDIPLSPAGKLRTVQSEIDLASFAAPYGVSRHHSDGARLEPTTNSPPTWPILLTEQATTESPPENTARSSPKKTTLLRQLIERPQLDFLMEAHNGLSAKIVEEAGFAGIWASGLSMSAALGVRDCNEASWTQALEMLDFMSDATHIPILVDGDTGYGNFNNMRRFVRKLEQRDIAGVCIEDKIFPKTNSFINGSSQPLADIEEFCGRVKAGKDAQIDDDFVIVARVEALIAGRGMKEALRRADAYHQAGADAILIHSSKGTAEEVLTFNQEWGNRCPVVLVPTKYYATPVELYREYKISAVIWANHLLRSSLAAMQQTARQIFKEQSLINVEDDIAALAEVFRLQGADELAAAEKRYLPQQSSTTKAIILAASRGEGLGDLTAQRPKCMVEIAGKPILAHIADTFRAAGISDIVVVRGYKKDAVTVEGLTYVDLDRSASTRSVDGLLQALPQLRGNCIITFGDLLVKKHVAQLLMETSGDFVIMADSRWESPRDTSENPNYITCSQENSRALFWKPADLEAVGPSLPNIHGEWMGLLKVSDTGAEYLRKFLGKQRARLQGSQMPDLLRALLAEGKAIRVVYSVGGWLDINSVEDVLSAGAF
jgi:phosphoenolpyruvate phosphomutase